MAKVNLEVRGLIYSKYVSEAACAKDIGWPRQKLNKITNGNKIPDLEEVATLAEILDVAIGDMAQFFLNNKSPNEQLRQGCEEVHIAS